MVATFMAFHSIQSCDLKAGQSGSYCLTPSEFPLLVPLLSLVELHPTPLWPHQDQRTCRRGDWHIDTHGGVIEGSVNDISQVVGSSSPKFTNGALFPKW
jgi:hypothetical protein|eukprot:CAMPEP_0174304390 /NCGR_PEP_ID=MMETSP0809-20121228/60763_1 /TAXON_ID=73025 ORGANISM="Eutreptiella gymnastica-like, Strain CCMP1594" /NCGR_SAMPLE_ID=MMETSP0809 /ASSEMBLY_ACC=CAM_ASM_000658 /LENGTH=98 /DNA_ID=CAMNT_0015410617 /DNA_START=2348 /DNA_END=2644 /DNA_ORIENTATION=-